MAPTQSRDLKGRSVAILATDGFEQVELLKPLEALQDAGADVQIISLPDTGESIRGWDHDHWGESVAVDATVRDRSPDAFDALMLPGGVLNPDKLRMNADAVSFVRGFFTQRKPVAAICHGPWMLVEADVARGRRVTSYPSLRTDLKNAGAEWVDEEVVVDSGLVTSRNPGDLDAFVSKMLEEIREGVHASQHA